MTMKSTFPPGALKPMVAPNQADAYYDKGGIPTLEIIQAKLTPEQYEGYLLGNVIKYSLRLNWKGQSKSDARKLADYSKWLSNVKGNV